MSRVGIEPYFAVPLRHMYFVIDDPIPNLLCIIPIPLFVTSAQVSSIMSTSNTATLSELSKLWKEDIDQYISEAKLSEKEQAALTENHKLDEVIDIPKTKENIMKLRSWRCLGPWLCWI